MDLAGGPRKWVENFSKEQHDDLSGIKYRWNNPIDFILMAHTLQGIFESYESIGQLFETCEQNQIKKNKAKENWDFDHAQTLDDAIAIIRRQAVVAAWSASGGRFQGV